MQAASKLKLIRSPESSRLPKYQALFEQASDAIMAVTTEGRIDSANLALEEMTGHLKSELEGQQIEFLVPPEGAPIERARPISREMLLSPGTYEDVAILRKDGYLRFVELTVRPVSDGDTQLVLALFRDLTEKKRMERELITKHSELRNAYHDLERTNAELKATQEMLIQAGKMAALGELAAGIAHELNQPLMGIRGYAQELQYIIAPDQKTQPDPKQAQVERELALREIISCSDKMAAIIQHLRVFTRKSTEQHELTDIHVPIEEALKMLNRQFASRGIQVERDFGGDLPKVFANPMQLEQVFINLASNARDAIEATGRGCGRIHIRTRVHENFVEILLRDDGCGMSEKAKAKAFNPFFTTKEVGKGMGLGLSLSYGIVSKIHGSMVVESEVGKGASFLVRVPIDFRDMG